MVAAGMPETQSTRVAPDLVIRSVRCHRGEIVARYLQVLEEVGSPLVGDRLTRDQLGAQATRILDDTIAFLHGEADAACGPGPDPISDAIGAQRARLGARPGDMLGAAGVLFEVAVDTIAPDLAAAPGAGDHVAGLCLALHRSIACRLNLAGRAYVAGLLDRLRDAHAEESNRASRDLHDRAAQPVVLALRELDLYEVYRVADYARAQAMLRAVREHLQEASDTIRALSTVLRKPEGDRGLRPALAGYLLTAAPTVATSVTVTGPESGLPLAIREELLLVLGEGIGNALRHAAPGTLTVRVRISSRQVVAIVADDGPGFDPEQAFAGRSGTGLHAMRERIHGVGGTLELDSRVGFGTTLRVRISLGRRPG